MYDKTKLFNLKKLYIYNFRPVGTYSNDPGTSKFQTVSEIPIDSMLSIYCYFQYRHGHGSVTSYRA